MKIHIKPRTKPVAGEIRVPSDKSITHRAFIFASMASGRSIILNPLKSRDCMATKTVLSMCGVAFEELENGYAVRSSGLLEEPNEVLNAGNSGTTARLMMGLLSAHKFFSVITGDDSLRKRPMRRVVDPLTLMGATILGRNDAAFLPVAVKGGDLKGITYKMPIPSAQVKSAIILASMYADGKTVIVEPIKSRDHTERMLKSIGADITVKGSDITVAPSLIHPFEIDIPSDPSSAAFIAACALFIPKSEVCFKDILLNPTRLGFFEVLKSMGADVCWEEERIVCGEPVGVLTVRYSPYLKSIRLEGEVIPSIIDEIPLIALVASQADGETVIRGAKELRVKESDRIKTTVLELSKLGIDIVELEDGMVIKGPSNIRYAEVSSHMDHRIAMMLAIGGIISKEGIMLEGYEWVDVSFPGFFSFLESL